MNRDEFLKSCMATLNDINDATRLALDTLNDNAYTLRTMMTEVLHGHDNNAVDPTLVGRLQELHPEPPIGEFKDIETLTDDIVAQIQNAPSHEGLNIHPIDIVFDPEVYTIEQIKDVVKQKLAGTYKKPGEAKEDDDDDEEFRFANPIA